MAEIHRKHDRGRTDEYRDALKNLIEQKIEHGDKAASSSLAERLADRVFTYYDAEGASDECRSCGRAVRCCGSCMLTRAG